MRRTISEQKVLKKLGIPNFRHMTKDKIVKFASYLPNMDREVAKKALEQFPEFKQLTLELVNHYEAMIGRILKSNDESVKSFYDACMVVLESLKKELDNPELTVAEKNRIEDRMLDVVQRMSEKDSENKRFLASIAKISGGVVACLVLAVAATLGASMQIKLPSNVDDDDGDYAEVD